MRRRERLALVKYKLAYWREGGVARRDMLLALLQDDNVLDHGGLSRDILIDAGMADPEIDAHLTSLGYEGWRWSAGDREIVLYGQEEN